MANEYISHHGVLGQKWGVRRYQNPDGTLTAAGRKKIYQDDGSNRVESYKSRARRSVEAWKQGQLASKYASKAVDARVKGNTSKANKYKDLANKANVNAKIYGKGLSKAEKEVGGYKYIHDRNTAIGAAVGTVLGNPIIGVLAGVIVHNIPSKAYSEASKAAKAEYDTWANEKIKNIGMQEYTAMAKNDYLEQKQGIRRCQNEDRTLTDSGKKHYLKTQEKASNLQKQAERNKAKTVKDRDRAANYYDKSIKKIYGGAFGIGKNKKKAIKYTKSSAKWSRKAARADYKSYKQYKKPLNY